jgi:hypothetical protein
MGRVLAAMAEVLAVHMGALDLDDENTEREYVAYRSLVQAQRDIASRLVALAGEMVGYRNLPMGRHNTEVMASPDVRDSFASFVRHKEELLALLQDTRERDQELLAQMNE